MTEEFAVTAVIRRNGGLGERNLFYADFFLRKHTAIGIKITRTGKSQNKIFIARKIYTFIRSP